MKDRLDLFVDTLLEHLGRHDILDMSCLLSSIEYAQYIVRVEDERQAKAEKLANDLASETFDDLR